MDLAGSRGRNERKDHRHGNVNTGFIDRHRWPVADRSFCGGSKVGGQARGIRSVNSQCARGGCREPGEPSDFPILQTGRLHHLLCALSDSGGQALGQGEERAFRFLSAGTALHARSRTQARRKARSRRSLVGGAELRIYVDVPDLDLVLPHNAAGLDDGAHDIAAQASAAWEAAVCWDDEYAIKRLAEVRAV